MKRQLVTPSKLLEVLNERFHDQDPCGQCCFTQSPFSLRTQDDSGCNWSQDFIIRYGPRKGDSCALAASQAFIDVSAAFNLNTSNAKPSAPTNSADTGTSATWEGMRSRETLIHIQIDTNRINARQSLENMNCLEKWHRDGVIVLQMSDIAYGEAKAGYNALRSRKASGYIYSRTFEESPRYLEMRAQISQILFPSGCQDQGDENDVSIVCNALTYSYILVTADGVILKHHETLAQLGLRVMTDAEAVAMVEEEIRERDAEAREDAAITGEQLPPWVGKD